MRVFKLACPAVIAVLGIFLLTPSSDAKVEYSKKEKKSCVFCHTKMGSKELNEAGKYYQEHKHSLEGYKPPAKK